MRGHRRVYPQAVRIHYHNWDPRWDENAERGGIGIDRIRPSSALLRPLEVSLANNEGAMDHGRRTHTHTKPPLFKVKVKYPTPRGNLAGTQSVSRGFSSTPRQHPRVLNWAGFTLGL